MGFILPIVFCVGGGIRLFSFVDWKMGGKVVGRRMGGMRVCFVLGYHVWDSGAEYEEWKKSERKGRMHDIVIKGGKCWHGLCVVGRICDRCSRVNYICWLINTFPGENGWCVRGRNLFINNNRVNYFVVKVVLAVWCGKERRFLGWHMVYLFIINSLQWCALRL